MARPEKFDLKFPSRLGKIHTIQYYAILNKYTGDKNYLKAISDYENDSDSEVSKFAKHAMERISRKKD